MQLRRMQMILPDWLQACGLYLVWNDLRQIRNPGVSVCPRCGIPASGSPSHRLQAAVEDVVQVGIPYPGPPDSRPITQASRDVTAHTDAVQVQTKAQKQAILTRRCLRRLTLYGAYRVDMPIPDTPAFDYTPAMRGIVERILAANELARGQSSEHLDQYKKQCAEIGHAMDTVKGVGSVSHNYDPFSSSNDIFGSRQDLVKEVGLVRM
ncbi:hypothetical protein P170DRAFT_181953 [Aspergillus steynii IBT 23096]|uniref:Uncharacterized protein n=1 Tax=Aspergillus steynii IBT 23096 TaxID=1392250 RepID=A0A2I2G8X9_9EURO|nr:uncharacterized protein P170DRAFT_181953 [Aspergillus steynii IBT 23096]PLB49334.1 hypothetical protein P170DRAFT_181953 [Aspergillus steynii IBT 23096]